MAPASTIERLLMVLALPAIAAAAFVAGVSISIKTVVQVQPLDQAALRVMTFNIRVDTASDGVDTWDNRSGMIAATIRFNQADIVGVQESYAHMTRELIARLPGYRQIGGSETMNPVLLRETRVELISWEMFWLSETPDQEGTGWDAEVVRTAVHVIVRERRSGIELHVFNVHLDHKGRESRAGSSGLLAERINALPEAARVILLGDFNCVDDSVPLDVIHERTRMRNGFDVSLTGNHGPTGTFRSFVRDNDSGRRLDHIFVQNLTVQQHGILADHYDSAPPSDHYPVLAEIVME